MPLKILASRSPIRSSEDMFHGNDIWDFIQSFLGNVDSKVKGKLNA